MLIGDVPAEAAVEVGRDHGGHRVHAAVQARHGRCQQPGNNQSRHPHRQLLYHKPWEDVVGSARNVQKMRMRFVKCPDRGSQAEEEESRNKGQRSLGPHSFLGSFQVGRDQVALNDGLIGTIGDELFHCPAEDNHPKGSRGKIPGEIGGPKFPGRSAQRNDRC